MRRTLLGFILLFGFCIRAATWQAPLFDHHAWRQADTASVARSFAREDFNPLHPQVDWRGAAATGYVETGFELLAFLTAAVWQVTGIHLEVGRLLPALAFLGSDLLTWVFVRRRYGDTAGLIAAFIYAFGLPLSLYAERAFMNEALLALLSIACLVAAQSWIASRRIGAFLALVAASTLLGVVKLPYLIIWAPIAGLCLEADGRLVVRRWELAVMAGANVAAAGLWYSHAHQIGVQSGLSFGLFDKGVDASLLFSPLFVGRLGMRLVRDLLGPVGVVAGVAGLIRAVRERRWCEPLGVAAFGAYLALVTRGNFPHDYYQLAIIPVMPALITRGLSGITAAVSGGRRVLQRRMMTACLALIVLSTFIRLVSFHSWFDIDPARVQACRAITERTAPADRLVYLGEHDPALMVCADRKGWLFLPEEVDGGQLNGAVARGAAFLVMPHGFRTDTTVALLSARGTLIWSGDAFELYKLGS